MLSGYLLCIRLITATLVSAYPTSMTPSLLCPALWRLMMLSFLSPIKPVVCQLAYSAVRWQSSHSLSRRAHEFGAKQSSLEKEGPAVTESSRLARRPCSQTTCRRHVAPTAQHKSCCLCTAAECCRHDTGGFVPQRHLGSTSARQTIRPASAKTVPRGYKPVHTVQKEERGWLGQECGRLQHRLLERRLRRCRALLLRHRLEDEGRLCSAPGCGTYLHALVLRVCSIASGRAQPD